MRPWVDCPQSKQDLKSASKQKDKTGELSVRQAKKVKVSDDASYLKVRVDEIKSLHDTLVHVECNCSSQEDQWRYIQDRVKDMPTLLFTGTPAPANSNVSAESLNINQAADEQGKQRRPKESSNECCVMS